MSKNDLLFLHIPRTGGTSIRTAMLSAGCKFGPCSPTSPWRPRHETAVELRKRIGKDTFDRCTTFSTVRNPFDRLVSYYYADLPGTPYKSRFSTFRAYVLQQVHSNHPFMQPQVTTLSIDGRIAVDKILRFERLAEDWDEFTVGMGVPPLPFSNRGSHEPWESYYNGDMARTVRTMYAMDFEAFNYPSDLP